MFTLTVIDSDRWIAGGIAHYFRERYIRVNQVDEAHFDSALTLAAGSDVIISEIRALKRDVQDFIELFLRIRRCSPAPRLIILTDFDEPAVLNYVTLQLPEAVILPKSTPVTELAGEIFKTKTPLISEDVQPAHVRSRCALTAREFGLLRMLATKRSLTDIGRSLELSVKTISHHKRNIMRKLNCRNTTELPTLLAEMGFGSPQVR